MCKYMCVHVCVHAYGGQRLLLGIFLLLLPCSFEAAFLHQTRRLLKQEVSLVSLLWRSPVSAFPGWNYRLTTTPTDTYLNSGDLNSALHVYMASALTTVPSKPKITNLVGCLMTPL